MLDVLLTLLTTAFVFKIENEAFDAVAVLAKIEFTPKKNRVKMNN